MSLWKCPECNSSVRAPSKLRRLDVRRWCLDCSGKATMLVERYCVARKSRQEAKQEREATQRQKKQEQIKEELQQWPWILYALFPKWCSLACWEKPEQLQQWQLKITFTDGRAGCRCHFDTKIVSLHASTDLGDSVAWLIWRMAQIDARNAGGQEIHWCNAFRDAINRINGDTLPWRYEGPSFQAQLWEDGKTFIGDYMNGVIKGMSSRKTFTPKVKIRKPAKRKKGLHAAASSRQRKAQW